MLEPIKVWPSFNHHMDQPLTGNKRKYRKPISEKQMTAIKLHAQGLSKSEAMRRAGYAETTINTPKTVFNSQAIKNAVERFKLELNDAGLTTAYWAAKFKEWADKGTILEQQNTYKFVKEVVLDTELKAKPEEGQITRRITLEEFIGTPTQVQQAPKQVENSPIEDEPIPHIADEYPNIQEAKPVEEEVII